MTKEQILNTRLTEEQIAMFYLGQEGFLIRYRDHFYLIDPYLSDSIDRHHGMQDADWTRRYDIPILPEELDFVDYVFCTHDHTDHADRTRCALLPRATPKRYSLFRRRSVKISAPTG